MSFEERRAALTLQREQGLLSEREHRRALREIERDDRQARIAAALQRARDGLEPAS